MAKTAKTTKRKTVSRALFLHVLKCFGACKPGMLSVIRREGQTPRRMWDETLTNPIDMRWLVERLTCHAQSDASAALRRRENAYWTAYVAAARPLTNPRNIKILREHVKWSDVEAAILAGLPKIESYGRACGRI